MIFVKLAGRQNEDVTLLVATIESTDAAVMEVRLNPDRLCEFIAQEWRGSNGQPRLRERGGPDKPGSEIIPIVAEP